MSGSVSIYYNPSRVNFPYSNNTNCLLRSLARQLAVLCITFAPHTNTYIAGIIANYFVFASIAIATVHQLFILRICHKALKHVAT